MTDPQIHELAKDLEFAIDVTEPKPVLIARFEQVIREAVLRASSGSPWQPISTAPEAERIWIFVPNLGCLIALKTTHVSDGAIWWDHQERIYGPTHWMPLPAPPAPAPRPQEDPHE